MFLEHGGVHVHILEIICICFHCNLQKMYEAEVSEMNFIGIFSPTCM